MSKLHLTAYLKSLKTQTDQFTCEHSAPCQIAGIAYFSENLSHCIFLKLILANIFDLFLQVHLKPLGLFLLSLCYMCEIYHSSRGKYCVRFLEDSVSKI